MSHRVLRFTAVIEREVDGYVALCPELDIASQGDTADEARRNLREAVEGFLEAADEREVNARLGNDRRVEYFEVSVA